MKNQMSPDEFYITVFEMICRNYPCINSNLVHERALEATVKIYGLK